MTKKIPLAIDAKPLAQAIDKSIKSTMTKRTMTKRTMTNNAMTYIAEVLAVVLILLLGVAILAL